MDIGGRLRTARKAAGLTQEGVARRSGLTLKHIGEVERGEVQDPHYSTLTAIAHALDVSVAELVGEEPALVGKAEAPQPGHQRVEVAVSIESEEVLPPALEHRYDRVFDGLIDEMRRDGLGDDVIAEYIQRRVERLTS